MQFAGFGPLLCVQPLFPPEPPSAESKPALSSWGLLQFDSAFGLNPRRFPKTAFVHESFQVVSGMYESADSVGGVPAGVPAGTVFVELQN